MGNRERRVEGSAGEAGDEDAADEDIARKLGVASVLFVAGHLDAQFPRPDQLCEQVAGGKGDFFERVAARSARIF